MTARPAHDPAASKASGVGSAPSAAPRASGAGAADLAAPDRHVVLLGSTGSIGRQALEVLETMPAAQLTGIVAHSNWELALEQCAAHAVPTLVLQSEAAARSARDAAATATGLPAGFRVLAGDAGVAELIHEAVEQAAAAGVHAGERAAVLSGVCSAPHTSPSTTDYPLAVTAAKSARPSMWVTVGRTPVMTVGVTHAAAAARVR